MMTVFVVGRSRVWLLSMSLCPVTNRIPGPEPGLVDGIDMFLTDSLMICLMVLRNAFLKSAVLKAHREREQKLGCWKLALYHTY